MEKKKKWEILKELRITNYELRIQEIIALLLENRGLKTADEIDTFLNPKLEDVTPAAVELDAEQIAKALSRIKKALDEEEQIIIFGDYDVDGITASAILWETLHAMGAKVLPYIPHRVDEGYGLSSKGIANVKLQIPNVKLIITVDNGIVASKAVEFAKEEGIDVIITDHHVPPAGGGEALPEAFAIVHTTKLCGAGVAYLLVKEITNYELRITNKEKFVAPRDDLLELVALGTIADLVPLTGANRTLVKFGLAALRKTRRPGLLALFQEAGIEPSKVGVYEVGHVIGPRLNAMGRMESAMDSLRLLCTKDASRAVVLAEKLGVTNRERQVMTFRMAEHAVEKIKNQKSNLKNTNEKIKKILIVYDESYEQGIIGLIAGRLVERFYRPAIVLSKGEKISKASARSIAGFNIIEYIRLHSHLILEHGGHPMAAGFSIETEKLTALQESLESLAEEQITEDMLLRVLRIDAELPLEWIEQKLFDALTALAPFGMGNPEPVFVSRKVLVRDMRAIGAEGKHLKMKVGEAINFDAIAFGMGEMVNEIKIGDVIDIAYTIDENTWNGVTKLQLKVKDIKRK